VQSDHTIVIGGGISGLAAGYDLARAGAPHTLLEARPRVGGVIETQHAQDCVLECGPDSFISAKPEALKLICELGLEDQVIASNDQDRVTYILKNGRLVPLPEGVMMMVPTRAWPMIRTPLIGWGTKIRMAAELFRKPRTLPDRSVADFVVDHFGEETMDYLAEPLLSGVYGGDVRKLSAASVLPRFVEMEAKNGSLARAALRAKRSGGGPLFRTLKNGLSQLVDALAGKVQVRHLTADAVERGENGFRVRAGGDWMDAGHVVIATPAHQAAGLVAGLDAELAGLLEAIGYSSAALVSLVYDDARFDGRRAGFGFLIPSRERRRLMAATFVTSKFPNRAPDGRLVLRCFFGGAGDEAVLGESDESLTAMARNELTQILNLTVQPLHTVVSRWPHSMAQYEVGHSKRITEIEARAGAIPGLYLAGNAYHGIGIPDCIRTGREAASRILKRA